MKTKLLESSESSFTTLADLLKNDEIAGLPTETVYGLAGNALSKTAVLKIFEAKERPTFDPLIVHVSERYLANPLAIIESLVSAELISTEVLHWNSLVKINQLLAKFWPGPLTLILPKGSKIPDEVTSAEPTVGIRCPAHPLFQEVLSRVPFPLAAPSANRFGRISPTEAKHVEEELSGRISAILDGGPSTVGVESTILLIEEPFSAKVLRPGKISAKEISAVLGISTQEQMAIGQKNQAQIAPGMLDQHYAPKKSLYLFPDAFSDFQKVKAHLSTLMFNEKTVFLSMKTPPPEFTLLANGHLEILSPSANLNEISKALFARLRALDADPQFDLIIADIPTTEKDGLAAAIIDRLNRASINKPFIKK